MIILILKLLLTKKIRSSFVERRLRKSEGHVSERDIRLWLFVFISQSFSLSYLPTENFYSDDLNHASYISIFSIMCK